MVKNTAMLSSATFWFVIAGIFLGMPVWCAIVLMVAGIIVGVS